MPSAASLSQTQYYAHPQNSFWFIMESLFSANSNLGYQQRVKLLHDNNIAVWDVLKNCKRSGSLDSAIEKNSIVTNDFNAFFNSFPSIKYVFFNGAKSQTEYSKHVTPHLISGHQQLNYHKLPSTSPAMASLKPIEKLEIWSIIKDSLD
ncbi:G:T/U mismatch-specific uracil/thymine DNA-glycosylase [hydrothermal vent metagenome]|uniref:G:T/U mismatch-specific uracil/thymine DNA-glycosylase n=1 Tax=hydrothermal vent metagenome TaxID=652676 RepID=A0A3B1A911_9ZZZZ